MPIRSLTERDSLTPPRLGVIRKGDPKIKKTNAEGKEVEVVGRDRDTFRVVFDAQYKAFQGIFEDIYTASPTEFRNIMLLGNSPDTIFENWYEEHVSAKLLHRCDGVQQVSRFVNGENVHDDAPCENKKLHPDVQGKGCNCNERGWLRIVLMDFTIASGVWGYFQVETGSIYDIIALNTYLRFIDNIQSLRGLRFVLGRAPKEITVRDPKDPNKRNKRTMSLLYLMVEPEQTKQYLVSAVNARDQLALSGRVDVETGEFNPGKEEVLMAHELADGTFGLPANVQGDSFVPPENDFTDIDVQGINDWDFETVQMETAHLFNHDAHFSNLLHKLMQDGIITNDMTTEDVIAIIKSNRADRRDEKLTDGSWWTDQELVKAFCSSVNTVTGLNAAEILKALNQTRLFKPAAKMSEFKGMPRAKAWALCLIASTKGDYDAARAKANDPEIEAWISDLFVEALPPPDLSGDIPF